MYTLKDIAGRNRTGWLRKRRKLQNIRWVFGAVKERRNKLELSRQT